MYNRILYIYKLKTRLSDTYCWDIMKLKENLQLRKVGRQYMIVDARSEHVNMSKVFTLNETAAFLWQKISENERTVDELVGCLCREYEVDCETGRKDVERQLEEWKNFGLIE